MSIIIAGSILLGSFIVGFPLRKIHKSLKSMEDNVKELNQFFNRKTTSDNIHNTRLF
jgi:hypothetical protein